MGQGNRNPKMLGGKSKRRMETNTEVTKKKTSGGGANGGEGKTDRTLAMFPRGLLRNGIYGLTNGVKVREDFPGESRCSWDL